MKTLQDYIKLAESATDGPWTIPDDDGRKNIRINMLTEIVSEYSPTKPLVTVSCTAWKDHQKGAKANAQFIAASRTLGPAMAKALIEAEEALINARSITFGTDDITVAVRNNINEALSTIQSLNGERA